MGQFGSLGPRGRNTQDRNSQERQIFYAALAIAIVLAIFVVAAQLVKSGTISMPPKAAQQSDVSRLNEAKRALQAGNTDTAKAIYENLAKQGNAKAELALGNLSLQADASNRGYPAAIDWYTKAATAGSARAQSRLGRIYLDGIGVAQDFALARKWLEPAARQGVGDAQYDLGRLYEHGWGIAKDTTAAYAWYALAAGQGDHLALDARDRVLDTLSPADVAAGQEKLSQLASRAAQASNKANASGLADARTSTIAANAK